MDVPERDERRGRSLGKAREEGSASAQCFEEEGEGEVGDQREREKDELVERSVPTKSLASDMSTLSKIVGYL